MYIVYAEIHKDGKVERWYYGTWADRDRANEVALDLDGYSEVIVNVPEPQGTLNRFVSDGETIDVRNYEFLHIDGILG